MICLNCGDCCKRMSPISAPEPCEHIEEEQGFVFCGRYCSRPIACAEHNFPAKVCPIGQTELNLNSEEEIQKRIDDWNKFFVEKKAKCRWF